MALEMSSALQGSPRAREDSLGLEIPVAKESHSAWQLKLVSFLGKATVIRKSVFEVCARLEREAQPVPTKAPTSWVRRNREPIGPAKKLFVQEVLAGCASLAPSRVPTGQPSPWESPLDVHKPFLRLAL